MNKIKIKKYIMQHLVDLSIKKNDNLVVHSDISKANVVPHLGNMQIIFIFVYD